MYSENEKGIIFIDNFDFATYKKKQSLLELIENPSQLLDILFVRNKSDLFLKVFTASEYEIIVNAVSSRVIDVIINNLEKLKISCITISSKDYPTNLINIDTPPFVIYYKGDKNLLNSNNNFAIVGSRHITNYGKLVTEKFTTELVKYGFNIVSGLAGGVDTVAHTQTIACKGKTIGVLAGGLDEIYPKTNTNLAKQIIEGGGLILTETRPYKKTEPYMFPIRNRIISALSKGILVTEAQEKSGVIHTKNYAIEYGKDVFAVPGSIFSLTSVGTNQMISNGQAKAVTKIEDILNEYNISQKNYIKKQVCNFSMEESVIINLLQEGEKSFQELVIATKYEVKTLNSLLTTLIIRGLIKKLAGNIYYLNS